jgi:hypothetical protein
MCRVVLECEAYLVSVAKSARHRPKTCAQAISEEVDVDVGGEVNDDDNGDDDDDDDDDEAKGRAGR